MGTFQTNTVLAVEEGVAYVDVSTPKHPRAVAKIDAADLDNMIDGCGRWGAHFSDKLYVIRGSAHQKLHRLLLGLEKGDARLGDHENGDGLDNRRNNLRVASPLQNAQNTSRRRRSTSKYLGVYWNPRSKNWRAECQANRQRFGLGSFAVEEAAARAYDVAAKAKFGEFANLNFPDG